MTRQNQGRERDSNLTPQRGLSASFAERLAAQYAQLTPLQQRIAQIIVRKPARLAFLSSEEVAAQARVSDTTVVRLATRLGYRGYGDLQRALQGAITEEMLPRDHLRRTLRNGDDRDVVSRLMEVDEVSIRSTRTSLELAVVQQAAEHLYRARRVAILGLRSSFAVAYFLYLRLLDVRDNVLLLGQPQGALVESLVGLHRDDLLVAISFARYTSATIQGATMARQQEVPVLAITDSPLSPLAAVASQTILVRADDVPAAAVSALSVCGALAVAAGRVDPAAARRRLARIETALQQARVFNDAAR